MLKHWIPWKFLIKRAARAYGIIDPLTFLARIRQFSQPSEVQEPIELVRAGIAFHTRGLINTKAIQHNLDWVWPYWVERQFNPNDNSFIPRAFSFSHVNLTHRNWTAVGHPSLPLYPIIDPRGLVTPLYDGWSIDFWFISDTGEELLPSKLDKVRQEYLFLPNPAVKTSCRSATIHVESLVQLLMEQGLPVLKIDVTASCPDGGSLLLALRPYNPEGIQFIETVSATPEQDLLVNGETEVRFNKTPEKLFFSNYQEGDVLHMLHAAENSETISCNVGMVTAAARYRVEAEHKFDVAATVPLDKDLALQSHSATRQPTIAPSDTTWEKILTHTAVLRVPDSRIQFLYDAAIRTLILLSAEDIVPGPYTYRRFWFRDACLMLNALMTAGLTDRAFNILDTFPTRQKISGYFQSQEGEWDSNGQVLWIMDRYQQLTGDTLPSDWINALQKGADWIIRKRLTTKTPSPHAGLLPPGFSAEHLGPNDYYYWDDFWGLAGLRSGARLAGLFHSTALQSRYEEEALDFETSIWDSIQTSILRRSGKGVPASPYRRMDAGAIGSMVADYPLQLTPPGDERISSTAEFLMGKCFHKNAFFQDMIHSGVNIYLTLAIAQTLLRNNDTRYRPLIQAVADLATPTGQWPEAIHPLTLGGCMGDGQHGWAAAEWLMMIRNMFVREEGDTLVLGSGILPEWITEENPAAFGPTQTPYGSIEVHLRKSQETTSIEIVPHFRKDSPPSSLLIDIPGYRKISVTDFDRKEFPLEESGR